MAGVPAGVGSGVAGHEKVAAHALADSCRILGSPHRHIANQSLAIRHPRPSFRSSMVSDVSSNLTAPWHGASSDDTGQAAGAAPRYRHRVAGLTPKNLAMSLPVCPSTFIRFAVAMCSASPTFAGPSEPGAVGAGGLTLVFDQ